MTVTQRNQSSAHLMAMAMIKKYDAKKKQNSQNDDISQSIDAVKKMFIQGIVDNPEMYQEYMSSMPEQMTRLMQKYGITTQGENTSSIQQVQGE